MQPVIVLNTVGLTTSHLSSAPRLSELARAGWHRPLREVLPAVTCSAQASFLTGQVPSRHGIVGNGWYWRDLGEIRFWMQSNRLIQGQPLYQTARQRAAERGRAFRSAKLFWWFNQGAAVDWSVTPKPHYGADGNKVFDILGTPESLAESLKKALGPFPFPTFWGPMAGLPCTQWIGQCAARVVREQRPDLTLVYLPHLDYDTQRFGPQGCDWARLVGELDDCCEPILEAAQQTGAQVWVVNEYAHLQVNQAVLLNQALRQKGLLRVRGGPFGEMLDPLESRALAVCDHQAAHVYVKNADDREAARALLLGLKGVEKVYCGEEREQIGLNHDRAGDLVALAEAQSWFAYPYWLEERQAPNFARTVNIHAKPGYDPCELFFDPRLFWAKGRAMWRLVQKKLGFRTLFDVVPLDTSLVRGSHGLRAEKAEDKPVLIGAGQAPGEAVVPMTGVHDLILAALGLG
jgi:predicted AlkP superfamily pyrophosphatase or phosphodiesterase